MAAFNQTTLVGNLTRDPEVKFLQSGTAIASIGLAVNDRVKKNGEWTDHVNFFDVEVFGKTAEVAGEYLKKGSPVLFTGKLKQDRWESDGQKRSKIFLVAREMQMLGGRDGNTPQQQPVQEAVAAGGDEIPF